MNKNITTTSQNSKLALSKAKSLLNIANKILSKKDSNQLLQNFKFKPFLSEGHSDSVNSIAISPDGKTIVSGSSDKTIKIWDMKSGECLNTLEGHSYSIDAIAINPDGKTIVSGSHDRTIKIWDLKSAECLNTLEGHSYSIDAIAINPDGKTIVSGSHDRTIKIWDLKSAECLNTLRVHSIFAIPIAISPDGKTIVSGDYSTIKIWDMKNGEYLNSLEGHLNSVSSIAISPDGKTIVSGSWDNTIKIWDLESAECLNSLEGHLNSASSIAISPDGKTIVSGSSDKTIKIWDMKSGECLNTLEGHSHYVCSIAISPDGKTIVSGCWDKTIKIWDMKSTECIYTSDYIAKKVSIDKDGYFIGEMVDIKKYVRVRETPLSQRKLTDEEIKHFRKKGNFWEDKVWTDPDTSLMWQVEVEEYKIYTWQQAMEHADRLSSESYGGYSDWRVPTIDELKTILTKEAYENSQNYGGKTYIKKQLLDSMTMKDKYFWSSTEWEDDSSRDLVVNFSSGDYHLYHMSNTAHIRCVRGEALEVFYIPTIYQQPR